MVTKYDLGITVLWAGRRVVIVSRCYAGGEWLYGIRLPRGKVIDYVPSRLLAEIPK